MLQRRDGFCQSSLLAGLRGISHGFSSRRAGDMRQATNVNQFARKLGFAQVPLLAHQTHGNAVPGDGVVSKTRPVAVLTADCVPILLIDPYASVCAAVHAGWRGTLGEIAAHAVAAMVREGGRVERMHAAIGPHIGACCYDVPEARAQSFLRAFGADEWVAFAREGRWFVDLGWVNYLQLRRSGLLPHHIDAPPTCTSCQNSEFFSYRVDSRGTYGEMMAAIGVV